MPTPDETIARLEGQIQELRGENAERRTANRDLKAENAKFRADLAERDGRLADFEAKQGKPSELQARIDELTGENRQLKHSARFRDLATEAGVRPEAVDDAWGVLKLKADADEPDDAAIRAALDAAKEAKGYLFRADPAPGDKGAPKPAIPPAFGGGRGKDGVAALVLTREQRGDPKFMYENDATIKQNAAAGTLVYRD